LIFHLAFTFGLILAHGQISEPQSVFSQNVRHFLLGRMLLSLFAVASCREHRVLALLDSLSNKSPFSLFFSDLESIGANVTFDVCKSEPVQLERFGERQFDTIIILTGKSTCFGSQTEDLTQFLDRGGNAFVFSAAGSNDVQDRLFRHFSIRVPANVKISDVYGNTDVILQHFLAPTAVVNQTNPIVYNGGFATIERPNDFRIPVISGGLEHIMSTTDRVVSTYFYAYDLIPIYALQGRTGGRVVFVHSATFANDTSFENVAPLDGKPVKNGNRELLKQLTEYVTHYKSDVRIVSATHFDTVTKETPVQYRIKQMVTVVAELEFVENGEWKPFTKEEVQVEIFMLGTFIRRHMKHIGKGKFEATIQLPDRAGNFKIKVFTDKAGWRNAREEMAIAIRPLAIREKEKFLYCAQPYQLSTVLVMAAAFVGSVHYLYHRPSDSQ
jgi:hypothetical protein